MTDILRDIIVTKEKIIRLLEEQNKRLKIENSLLENGSHRGAKKKRMKPKHRRKIRHLRLIALNGVPVNGKGVPNDFQ